MTTSSSRSRTGRAARSSPRRPGIAPRTRCSASTARRLHRRRPGSRSAAESGPRRGGVDARRRRGDDPGDRRAPNPGDRLHLISHPRQLEVVWAYAAAHLRQLDAVNLGQDADGPPPAVLVLQAPLGDREAGGPVLDGRGNLVGLLAGKVGPQQQIGFAVTAGEVRAFLDEQRPLAHPASPSERIRRAEVFARAHAWRRALEEYEAANAFAGRAWAHYQLGDDAQAIRDATKAIARDPKDVLAHIARARCVGSRRQDRRRPAGRRPGGDARPEVGAGVRRAGNGPAGSGACRRGGRGRRRGRLAGCETRPGLPGAGSWRRPARDGRSGPRRHGPGDRK